MRTKNTSVSIDRELNSILSQLNEEDRQAVEGSLVDLLDEAYQEGYDNGIEEGREWVT